MHIYLAIRKSHYFVFHMNPTRDAFDDYMTANQVQRSSKFVVCLVCFTHIY
jgi:hypothetical protein